LFGGDSHLLVELGVSLTRNTQELKQSICRELNITGTTDWFGCHVTDCRACSDSA
jgi:hypothetical protein